MSNENWIKFEEAMPKLNQEVQIKFDNEKIEKVNFSIDDDDYGFSVNFCLEAEKGKVNLEKVTGWRPLKSENIVSCIECNNNFKPKDGEKICDSCFYGYKKDEWTLFEDKLPKLGKLIEICDDDGTPEECRLVLINDVSGGFKLLYKKDNKMCAYDPYYYKRWRYKKEKRPDFDKLKKGDIIVGNLVFTDSERNFFAGCFQEITEDGWLRMTFRDSPNDVWDGFEIKDIKRILKINLERQTFEEI